MASRFTRRQMFGAAAMVLPAAPGFWLRPAHASEVYDLVDVIQTQVDPLNPRRFMICNDLNEAGDLLGNIQVSDEQDVPFLVADGVRRSLEAGPFGARATGFLSRDRIAGRAFTGWGGDGLPIGRPVLWLDTDQWPLPLPEQAPSEVVNVSVATAHPDGRVAGSLTLASDERIPVLWRDREPIMLPKLVDFPRCEAQMLLSSGIIGGTASDIHGFDYPVFWKDGVIYLLPTATGTGYLHSHAAPGAPALYGSMQTGSHREATLWRDAGFEILPALAGNFKESWVEGMNADGVACGTVARHARRDTWTAVLWMRGSVTELSTIVEFEPGVRLIRATAINNAGQIAAAIWPDGTLHVVLLNPH
jgi:hypothetical protein